MSLNVFVTLYNLHPLSVKREGGGEKTVYFFKEKSCVLTTPNRLGVHGGAGVPMLTSSLVRQALRKESPALPMASLELGRHPGPAH